MKYALSESGSKIEPTKGAKGICPICKEPLIAKCGRIKVHHWAHKSGTECDPWTSSETIWHRNWKNCFPKEWQEVLCEEERSIEIHRADVKTPYSLVLEFQHSPIEDEEKVKREKFYKNMLWVVDTSKKRCRNMMKKAIITKDRYGFMVCSNANDVFPEEWLNRNVFVFLDYKGEDSQEEPLFDDLICIIPTVIKNNIYAYFLKIERKDFISGIKDNTLILNLNKYAYDLNIKTIQYRQRISKTQTASVSYHPPIRRKFRF